MWRLSYARHVAETIVEVLKPKCTRIEIAGSIRRRTEALVSDIEIVCAPLKRNQYTDLFQTSSRSVPLLSFTTAIQLLAFEVLEGSPESEHIRFKTLGGEVVDLYMPFGGDFYRILAIRTGPSDYIEQVLVPAWEAMGWVETSEGLRRLAECRQRGNRWFCRKKAPTKPPSWHSEQNFFEWLGVELVHPSDRRPYVNPIDHQ